MNAQTVVEIDTLIDSFPGVRGGRPVIAGTGVTVKRIAGWHQMGMEAEAITDQYGHLTLAQVHAALAYYYANRAAIDADLEEERYEYERLLAQTREGQAA
ncbi:MAG: DUF433 domain-containing protein [Verrucomicrobia bacterium]|nr:DUF433 domain-containing protein [Verrucomicrobiota bacterium]